MKDRVALQIVTEALADGRLVAPGGLITEGTAGSTGIALAMVGWAAAWARVQCDLGYSESIFAQILFAIRGYSL